MKYLFIDTNNFINCGLEIEIEQAYEIINKLKHLLDSDKTELLLPEIVEVEFFRVIDYRLSKIKEYISNLKTVVKKFPLYVGKDKEDFIKDMDEVFNNKNEVLLKRKQSSDKVKLLLKTIFSGKHIIRISLTPDIFLRAIKRALAGRKPYKYRRCPECNELKNIINIDCLIFESIISKMKELGKDNELIFCSTNTEDFADKNNKEINRALHHDLLSDFPKNTSVRYYYHFAEAMKYEFAEKILTIHVKDIIKTAELIKASSSHLESTFEAMALASAAFRASDKLKSTFEGMASTVTALRDADKLRSTFEGMASAAAAFRASDKLKSTFEGMASATAALQDSGIFKNMKSIESSFQKFSEALKGSIQEIQKQMKTLQDKIKK